MKFFFKKTNALNLLTNLYFFSMKTGFFLEFTVTLSSTLIFVTLVSSFAEECNRISTK